MRFCMAVSLGSCRVFSPQRRLAPAACSTSVYPEILAGRLCARALLVLLCTFMGYAVQLRIMRGFCLQSSLRTLCRAG